MKKYILISGVIVLLVGLSVFIGIFWEKSSVSHELVIAQTSVATSTPVITIVATSTPNVQAMPSPTPSASPIVVTKKVIEYVPVAVKQSSPSPTPTPQVSSTPVTIATPSPTPTPVTSTAPVNPSITVDAQTPLNTSNPTIIIPNQNFLQLDLPAGYSITKITYSIQTADTNLGVLNMGQSTNINDNYMNATGLSKPNISNQGGLIMQFQHPINYVDISANNFSSKAGLFKLLITEVDGYDTNNKFYMYAGTPIATGWYQTGDSVTNN